MGGLNTRMRFARRQGDGEMGAMITLLYRFSHAATKKKAGRIEEGEGKCYDDGFSQ